MIRQTRSRLAASTAAIALFLPLAAPAQEDLGTIVLETDLGDGTGPVEGPDPTTLTGSGTPARLSEIPQSISVIGTEERDELNVTSVSEALRYTAGVFSEPYGDDTDYDWHFIRGFQSDQTGVFWDGLQNLSFGFGSYYVDPYTLERIEVLRGPAAVLYGGSNPGGLLNYVSKRPGEDGGELTFGVNDAGGAWAGFDIGQDLGDGRSSRLIARIEGGDKYDDFNDGFRGVLAPSVAFELGEDTQVTLLGTYFRADEQHSGGSFLPYAGTVRPTAAFGTIDPEANYSDPDWDSYEREQALVTAIVEHRLSGGWALSGTARIGHADIQEQYYYPFGYDGFQLTPQSGDPELNLIGFAHDSVLDTLDGDVSLTGSIQTGAVEHALLFGLDARRFELDQTQASNALATNDPVDPTGPGTPELADPYIDSVTTQETLGLYVQDRLRWGNWITTLNLRHDWVDLEIEGLPAFERDDSETSYRAGLAYEFANGLTPYASYSSVFLPTIASPADGVTAPESGNQVELGVKYAPAARDLFVTAALFRIDRENVVAGSTLNLSQLGEVRSEGFEIEGRYGFDNGLAVTGAATVLDLEITGDSDPSRVGLQPTLIPEEQAALRVDYAFEGAAEGLVLGTGLRYRGASYADDANTLEVPSATLLDLYAGYDWDSGWGVDFAVTNLEDEGYVTGCADLYTCSYGAERQVSLEVSRRW